MGFLFVGLTGRNKEQNETALFLYIFYRIGIVCPELIRVVKGEGSISA